MQNTLIAHRWRAGTVYRYYIYLFQMVSLHNGIADGNSLHFIRCLHGHFCGCPVNRKKLRDVYQCSGNLAAFRINFHSLVFNRPVAL